MATAIIGLLLGLVIGAGCRFFDIPSPAPPRLIGACLLLAMTLGFVAGEHVLLPGTIAKHEVSIVGFLVNEVAQFEPY
jgi:XapX domain-containing protein